MLRSLTLCLAAMILTGAASAQTPAECQARFAEQKAAEIEAIEAGMSVYASVPENERDPPQAETVARALALMADRNRPVDSHDLAIIDLSAAMLSSEENWDRADDRDCGPEDAGVSIFCALQTASVAILGRYEHRRTALQEVRFIIAERSEGRDYAHRLQDYNNDPSTTLEDVASLFDEARLVLVRRLYAQASCEG